jgi:hypothetical protein
METGAEEQSRELDVDARIRSAMPPLPYHLSDKSRKFQVWLWLERINLVEYLNVFSEYGIDKLPHDSVRNVEEGDLKNMGILRPIHVKKLRREMSCMEVQLFLGAPGANGECPLTMQRVEVPVLASDGQTLRK